MDVIDNENLEVYSDVLTVVNRVTLPESLIILHYPVRCLKQEHVIFALEMKTELACIGLNYLNVLKKIVKRFFTCCCH